VEAMNIRAGELGLRETYFLNPTGLDISETEAGAFGSARDMAFLMDYILKNQPGILERTKEEAFTLHNVAGVGHEAENTNVVISEIAGLIGSKTGYTTLSGGNLAIAYDASLNRPIVVVVLGSTINGRFSDVLKLVEASRVALK
jgi:D-alanyl-D-alanine carboxypeptidase (penicillin-binding protein 5/6)